MLDNGSMVPYKCFCQHTCRTVKCTLSRSNPSNSISTWNANRQFHILLYDICCYVHYNTYNTFNHPEKAGNYDARDKIIK